MQELYAVSGLVLRRCFRLQLCVALGECFIFNSDDVVLETAVLVLKALETVFCDLDPDSAGLVLDDRFQTFFETETPNECIS